MTFASNDSFLGCAEEEFEDHVTTLSSTLLRNLDTNAYQVAFSSDEGARTIESRGLIFISRVAFTLLINLGTDLTNAATACALTPYLMRTNKPHSELATN